MPENNWPSIRVPEATRVLSAAIIERSSDDTKTELERIGESGIQFRFVYLNPGDGIVFELLVDGDLAPSNLQISAPVIGGSAPQFADLQGKLTRDMALSALGDFGIVISTWALAGWFVQRSTLAVSSQIGYASIFSMGVAIWALAQTVDRRHLRRRLPAFAHRYLNATVSRYNEMTKKTRVRGK